MDMQDNEMDNLFRAGLDDLEVQPSAGVWGNIDAQLGAGKRKKMLLPFLSAAASIVVLITAGILIIPQKQSAHIKHHVQKSIVANHDLPNPVVLRGVKGKPTNNMLANNTHGAFGISISNNRPAIRALKMVAGSSNTGADTTMRFKITHASTAIEVTAKPTEQIGMLAADKENKLKTGDSPLPLPASNGAVTTPEQASVTEKPDAVAPKKKHHINSFGDMINIVIAKIDKRKNKVIEFSDTDGDEATITSVNLGFVKISKDEK